MSNPTQDQYTAYAALFDFFNERLFGGQLPPVILNFSRKSHQNLGFFAPKTWVNVGNADPKEVFKEELRVHEISVNPDRILDRGFEVACATLVHEMVHLWQQVHGKPGSNGYHNREWGSKMDEVGLVPSHTGKPGGRRTGVQMTDYVNPEGRFAAVVKDAPRLPFLSSPLGRRTKGRNLKVKYACPGCEVKAYGKKDLRLVCFGCKSELEVA